MAICNMELDLDAFLQFDDASTSDDEDDSHHRSTVDELLLIDSDASSSSSSSPRRNNNTVDSDSLRLTTSQLVTDLTTQSNFRSTSQLPRLFRSNAKPGAALAAAAAASRLIPSPHAAAIREKSSTDPKPDVGITVDSGTASEFDSKEDFKLDHLDGNFEHCGEVVTEHESKNLNAEDFLCEENASDVEGFDLDFRDDSPHLILDNEGEVSVPDDSSNKHIPIITLESVDMNAKESVDTENLEIYEKDVEYDLQAKAEVSVNLSDETTTRLKPLEAAEELEKKHAFTGLHWEEGAAAQPMKLEGVNNIVLAPYFSTSTDNTVTRTISSPSFRRDHGTPQAIAVHLNYIALGMSRGLIVVVPSKYSPHYADNMDAKMLMLGLQGDRSYAPVTSMSFNHQGDLLFAGYADGHYTVWDVQRVSAAKIVTEHKAPVVHMLYLGMDSRQVNMVSGDSKGVVKLIRFSPSSWLSRFSTSKPSTLLDESTSTVVCASPLVPEERYGDSSTNATVGTESTTGGGDLTCAEEGVVIFVTHQSALVAKVISNKPEVYGQLPKPDGVREGSMPYAAWKYIAPSQSQSQSQAAAEKESGTAPLLALAWDNQVQVAKLVKSELKIHAKWTLESSAIGVAWLDDQMLVVLTSAGQLCLYANNGTLIHDTSFAVDGDDVIGHHTHFSNVVDKAHHNCIAVRGASLYLLGPTHLVVSRLLPWKERVEVLRRGGDWMGAFNMAMVLYNGQAQAHDLPRSLDDVRKVIMPYLVELLLAYVDEVFSYISVAALKKTSEQYTSVGGVAVELCVHIKRTDILFDEILSRFESVQQKETFLELLEPYILKDMLGSLPPEIMQALVEHYSAKAWLQRVEQCVLHMDISSLDFNQVVRLCREHNLYRALIYLFNKGLDDFRTPLEELLLVFTNSDAENAPSLGYRMLVYLKYCFTGLAFPPGHGALSPARLPSLRRELIHLLLEDSNAPSPWGLANLSAPNSHKNLYHLLELDTEATLDVLRCAFIVIDEIQKPQSQHLAQKTVDILVLVLETPVWPSKDDVGHILEFISSFVSRGEAKVSNELLRQIFEYLTLDASSISFKIRGEKEVLALLKVVPQTDWDDRYLLDMCEKAHFYQACGFIYDSRHHYIAALDSFMKDVDEPVHAFSYIHNLLLQRKRLDYMEAAVVSRIPDLVQISREGTVFIVFEHFFQKFQQILGELRSHPKSLFLFLKTVIEAHSMSFSSLRKEWVKNQVDDFLERLPKSLRENPVPVTDEMTELYLELLCQYEGNSVLHFLETCESSYRVDHCLRLCQEYKIIDAAAFLLERVGDVGSALSYTLSDLEDKFSMLDYYAFGPDHLMKKEVNDDILHIVRTSVGLCQRNSSRLDSSESEALWFQLLDKFCEALTKTGGGLRKLLCIFIKEIVEGMIGYVRLPTVMMKLLSDNGSQEFGDFKPTILGMLGTYDFERRILDTARCLIEEDTYYSMTLLKRGACHGHGPQPQSLVCVICSSCLVTKDSPGPGIRVYSCGHASHLHCSQSHAICTPKKKSRSGLVVSKIKMAMLPKHKLSSHLQVQEKDDRQISRYEILSNLDKDKNQVDNMMPPLRLAPPAVYQEKVAMLRGEGTSTGNQIKDSKTKGGRFPLKSNIFGKEKTSRR